VRQGVQDHDQEAFGGLTPEECREKYGYKKGEQLVAQGLARERRK
jgi:hypothetical protein